MTLVVLATGGIAIYIVLKLCFAGIRWYLERNSEE